MSLGLSLEYDAILTRLEVGRLCSAPDDLLKRDAAHSSSSYTGRIQKSEVKRERVSSFVRAITGCCRTGPNNEAISLARYVATRTVRVLAKELICRRHRQGCDFVAISSIKKPTTSPSSLLSELQRQLTLITSSGTLRLSASGAF